MSANATLQIDVRPPLETDLETLERDLPLSRPDQHRECLAQHESGRVSYLVAWQDGTPVGHGLVHWSGPRSRAVAKRLPDCPEIYMLGVQERLRSRGIGGRLLASLEELAVERKRPRVGLGVSLENRRARRLYHRAGYVPADVPLYVDRWSWIDAAGKTRVEADRCEFLAKPLRSA